MGSVNVNIAFLKETISVTVSEKTVAEDVVIEICKIFKIGPVAKSLFALRQILAGNWLNFSCPIKQEHANNLEFALRYHVPDADRLKKIDRNAFNFYFRQAKHSFLESVISDDEFKICKNEIIALGVIDMLRATVEQGLSAEQVVRDYKNYLPRMKKRKHKAILKSQVTEKFKEIRTKDLNIDDVKIEYLNRFQKAFPRYLTEEYRGIVNNAIVNVNEIIIRVNPFDTEFPGVSVKYENKKTVSTFMNTLHDLHLIFYTYIVVLNF